jgi:glycosyltransferase involved in cell wall biosynthesis
MKSDNKNVCLITLRPEYKLGGQTESLINLAKQLNKKGLEIGIIDPLNSNLLCCDQENEHFTTGEVTLNKFFLTLKLFLTIIKLSKKFDILQIHLPTPAFSIFADLIKIFSFKKKVIVVYEGHLLKFCIKDFINNLKSDFKFYFIRYLINNKLISLLTLKLCSKYIVSTVFQKKELISLGYKESKIRIIPNSTDVEKFTPTIEGLKKFDNLPIKNNLLLYIGHFWDTKGVADLIKAFNIIQSENNNLKLVLAWSGLGKFEPLNYLINKYNLENKIIILGKVKVQNLIARTKLLILPYRFSYSTVMFPNLILEAFTVGIPVLTTNLPPLTEIIKENETGFLTEPCNPDNLAKKIKYILTLNSDEINKISNNQRHKIETVYNPVYIANKFIDIYNNL